MGLDTEVPGSSSSQVPGLLQNSRKPPPQVWMGRVSLEFLGRVLRPVLALLSLLYPPNPGQVNFCTKMKLSVIAGQNLSLQPLEKRASSLFPCVYLKGQGPWRMGRGRVWTTSSLFPAWQCAKGCLGHWAAVVWGEVVGFSPTPVSSGLLE